MPERETIERAREDAREGKSASTQAGEFVREEIHHIREGKHGAASPQQAIAIGLSKARRAGVKLPAPAKGKTSSKVREQASRDNRKGRSRTGAKLSTRRSRATLGTLNKQGTMAASHRSLSRQATASAKRRGASGRHKAAMKAVRTKGAENRSDAAKKAAQARRAA